MRVLRKALKIILLGMAVLVVVLVGATLVFRAYRQHVNARIVAIHTPNGIDEGMYVKIGGIDQWMQIRGDDRNNPVLLCLHGGPGGSWLGNTKLLLPWEREFTVVQWDQRGTGKTLETTGTVVADSMSVDRMAQDGIEVAEFLRDHLHKDKIVVLGFSWGSLLGVHMVKQRPDLFYAYVGTGQISDMAKAQQMSYAYVLKKRERQRMKNPSSGWKALVLHLLTIWRRLARFSKPWGATNANRTGMCMAGLSQRLTTPCGISTT
jgi:pimeloyl-ACP methyl ester carboxylesterase